MGKKAQTLREQLGFEAYSDPGIDCSKDPILVEEHHAEDLDINKLVKRYGPKEILDLAQTVKMGYGDFSNIDDYHTMMNKVIKAQDSFMQLPAEIRSKFNNDPAELVRAIQLSSKDEKIEKELIDLKLIKEKLAPPLPKPNASAAGGGSVTPGTGGGTSTT